MNKSHVISAEGARHHNKNRNFLRIILFLTGVIILLASIFLLTVVYRTIKSNRKTKTTTITDSNLTDSNLSCQYGETGCHFGALCTEQNECQCISKCTDDQCRSDQVKCLSFYSKSTFEESISLEELTCSVLNCSHGAKCVINDSHSPHCSCPNNCHEYTQTLISISGPICGSDHQTYETICHLKKRACERQENISILYLGKCQDSFLNDQSCDPYINCSENFQPICASNLYNYSNECQMYKYACQSKINLTKLHDGLCYSHEQDKLREVCQRFICLNGKTCMIENGIEVCRCLFNCSSEKNQKCASNGILYRNMCELERERCLHDEQFVPVDLSHCCDAMYCPYGQCKQSVDNKIECECKQCSNSYTEADLICGENGITYPSKCHLEHDACRKQMEIKPQHMGQCDNCRNVICPFNGICRSNQGNYTCLCPSKNSCTPIRTNESFAICGSNQELFYSQCEMDVRSCELKTHLYTIATHHCLKDNDRTEHTDECGYDEALTDLKSNRHIECDVMDRCPLNSYCRLQSHRCCVKVLTAVLPYRMCRDKTHCGKNMICLNGLCQCAGEDFVPARNRRECISSKTSTCHASPFGCCKDNVTISPTFDRRGCPEYCSCHPTGSLRTSCDPKTNFCYCRPAVSGSRCSHCENEYWAFSRIVTHNNTGCTPCGCHPYGSIRKDCIQDTGQCLCHPFAIGRRCDKCNDTSLTLTSQGCLNVNKNRRRRQRTCQDFHCLFDGKCEIIHNQPYCTCQDVFCTDEEERLMNLCASDGRTYKSMCEIKRQQCAKQYEIVLIYFGVCHGIDEDVELEDVYSSIDRPEVITTIIDSKRCVTDRDCGENMVCLSEFCECAQQKYQRISGPRCLTPSSADTFKPNRTGTTNSVRHTSIDTCTHRNPCENHGICQNQVDGSYKCGCLLGWKGKYCTEKITINFPYLNRYSYLEWNEFLLVKHIDLTFTTEKRNGLIFYTDNKLIDFDLIISIRNKIIEIIIRTDQFNLTYQFSDTIDLNTLTRLQVQFLYNEIQIKINNGNIFTSRVLPFEILLRNRFYLGGVPDSFNSLYEKYNLDDGFQGCIQKFLLNGKSILFNHPNWIGQNIDQCPTNFCETKFCENEISSSLINRCLNNPCENNKQCVNIYPENYLCLCSNCSMNTTKNFDRYTAGFHSNSYVKHLPLQGIEHTGKFQIEIWFLTETSSGSIIYSEHMNTKKGYIKFYLHRKMLLLDIVIGSKTILLSSRYPIELNRWHQCIIEIYGQKLSLILDQEPPVISYELFSSNLLWPRSFTYFGHSSNMSLEGFRGAIQKIILNNQQIYDDIRLHAIEIFNLTEYHGYPCQPNPCSSFQQCSQTELNNYTCEKAVPPKELSLELDGTIHAIYAYRPVNLNRNHFQFHMKTKSSLGLIFYLSEISTSFFSNYFSLILVDGFLQFTVKIQDNSTEVIVKSKIRIDDGRWHRVEIERFRRRIILKLDEIHRYQSILSPSKTEFHPNPTYIYIGGYHRLCTYNENHCHSYRGCLKDFTIDQQSIDLINDEINSNRLLKQCHDFY